MRGGSSTTAEPAGFRIERRLGEDVWEATQVELSRRVALRRLPPGSPFDAGAWPHRDGVVALYAAVRHDGATYLATRFIPGARTLAQLRGARAGRRRRWLDEAARILDGTVHGDLTEHDILLDADGRAFVTGFGRVSTGDAELDRAALARMRTPGRRSRTVPVAAGTVVLVAGASIVALRGDGAPSGPPPVPAGASAVGSSLASGPVRTLDCEGLQPGGGSPPCTILQTALPGRPLRATERGLVRGFAVRGATGPLRLQILQGAGGRYAAYNISRTVTVTDPGRTRYFRVDLSVPRNARFGLEIGPGGGAGLRTGVAGAATARFLGPANAAPRAPDTGSGSGQELLLRVDVVRRPTG